MWIQRFPKPVPVLHSVGTSGWLDSLQRRSLCVANWIRGVRDAKRLHTGDSRLPWPHIGSLLFWAFSGLFETSLLQLRRFGSFKPPCHLQGHHLLEQPVGLHFARGMPKTWNCHWEGCLDLAHLAAKIRSLFKVAPILERIREMCEDLYFKDIKEVCRNPRKTEHQGPGGQDLKAAGRPQQQELRAFAGLIIWRLYWGKFSQKKKLGLGKVNHFIQHRGNQEPDSPTRWALPQTH